jgi:asparagine synthase (glutamine-hydrolysing)
MPNYGGNDGASVLPLTSCDYQDYRPSLQAAHYLVHRRFCFAAGPWNEMTEWLFVAQPHIDDPPVREREVAASPAGSGYVKLAMRSGYALLRTAEYRDRPAQADQLHLDVWWRGENIACDAGTYLYGGDPPWQNGLVRTAVHNTVMVGGRDQMTRAGRFLWLDWAQARVALASECGLKVARASHDGYKKIGAVHQRSVFWSEEDDFWIVIDEIVGKGTQSCRLHWLFPDTNHDLQGSSLGLDTSAGAFKVNWRCSTDSQISLARAGEIISGAGDCDQTRGWGSLYYSEKIPALSLAMECMARLPVRFVTVLAPEEVDVAIDNEAVRVRSESHHYKVPFSVCSVPPW